MNNKEMVYVESEFAPLKRVVLAQSEFILPNEEHTNDDGSFLEDDVLDMFNNQDTSGKNYAEVFPERQKQWEEERRNLQALLVKYGVEVSRPRLLTDYEKENGKIYGASNFFVRDPFFTIGDSLIEGSMRFFHRRHEVLPVRELLTTQGYNSEALYVSLPVADTSLGENDENGPFLEGGDILILNKTVFVGNSGKASNQNGYLWLKAYLAHWDYEVVEVKLHPDVLHLDCALSLVREGLMIVCEEALLTGLPEALKAWDRIDVPFEDIAKLAINGLPINEEVYILDKEFKSIGGALEARGIKTEYLDFKISRSLGGSFRCSTQPLLRK
jgi:N-dimethylarginine dimethylaminohydrolase